MKKSQIFLTTIFILIIILGVYLNKTYNKSINSIMSDDCMSVDSVSLKVDNIQKDLSKYSKVTKDIVGQSSEGGEQINFNLNGNPSLIKQTFYGETGKSEVSFYLENNKVFFIKKKNSVYKLPISEDPTGVIASIESKDFYLNTEQNLCSWYKDKILQKNDADTTDLVNYLLSNL